MGGGDGDSPPVDPRLHANSNKAYDFDEGDVGDPNMNPLAGRNNRGNENHVESPQPEQEDVDPRYQIDPAMLALYDDHEDWRMNGDDEELEDPGELVRETTPHEEPEEEESEEDPEEQSYEEDPEEEEYEDDPEEEYEEEPEENQEEEGLQENFENGEFEEDFDGPVIIIGNIIENPDGIIEEDEEEEELEEDEEEEEMEVPHINEAINHQANLTEE